MSLPRVSVVGCGYLGVTHAVCMAELGFQVVGVETSPHRLSGLRAGQLPVYEPGLQPMLTRHVDEGNLRFTDSLEEAASECDVHFVCVGTPQLPNSNAADTSAVFSVVERLARVGQPGSLIVGKSTVPVGTARRLHDLVSRASEDDVDLAWNPEFLREGHAIEDTLTPDRLVFGLETVAAEQKLRAVYERPLNDGTPLVVTDFETAELSKVAANSYLAMKVSFINGFADMCHATGADVVQLADALGHDTRIGRRYLHAGVGFGGGCLPKDVRALRHRAEELGTANLAKLMSVVDDINQDRHASVVRRALELAPGETPTIAVLGASFKPHTDDIRNSSALLVASRLEEAGARIQIYDPRASDSVTAHHPTFSVAASVEEACADADLVLHLTEWPEFRDVDPAELKSVVAHAVVLDARNCLDRATWRDAGWHVSSMGRP